MHLWDLRFVRKILSTSEITSLLEARMTFLGPREERSATAPVENGTGEFTGGTFFERVERPDGIEKDSRAYGVASSDQRQNSVMGPISWGKLPRGTPIPASQEELPLDRQVRPAFIKVAILNILDKYV